MIGILGGTFDPIHYGHLRTGLEVCEALGLEQLRLIPLKDPPHRGAPDCSPEQRLAMVRAAAAAEPRFVVDDRELRRAGKSYTLLTVESLRAELGPSMPICVLLGSDAFAELDTWHRPEAVLQQAHVVVMTRPGDPPPALYPELHAASPQALAQRPGGRIWFQSVSQLEISATAIRRMIRAGASPRFLLPELVLQTIVRERLYI